MADPPLVLSPGEAVYVNAADPVDLQIPDPTLRIRYYHEDHLGSSSVITDGNGALVEETSFYPFGIPHSAFEPRHLVEPYQFTQKERDRESTLFNFEARYLGSSSRFLIPDVKYDNLDGLGADDLARCLSNPQEMNLYAYVCNNPLSSTDPSGLDKESEEQLEKNEKYTKGGEAGILALDTVENLASHGSTLANSTGGLSIALNVGVATLKLLAFAYNPTVKGGVDVAWHGTKAIGTLAAPEIFIPLQGGDLVLREMKEFTDEKVAGFHAAAKSLDESAKSLEASAKSMQESAQKAAQIVSQIEAQTKAIERRTGLLHQDTARLKYLREQEQAADSKQFKAFWHERYQSTIEYYHKLGVD